MPIQQPMAVERKNNFQCLSNSAQVCQTTLGLMRALLPLKARPSSMVSRISPMPKSPITAIRKSKPLSISGTPKVMRSCPVTESIPTAASANPSIIAAIVLAGGSLLMPTKLQKVSS
jgi:hypothetical protein